MSASRSLRRLQRQRNLPNVLHATPSSRHQTLRSRLATPCSSSGALPVPRRHFSTTGLCRAPERAADDVEPSADRDELGLEEEMLVLQNAAIAELEQRLGKSLERAVTEDQLAERLLRGQYAVDRNGEDESEAADVEAIDATLIELRDAGSSTDEVVREARNIFGDYLPQNILQADEIALYKRLYGEPLEADLEKAADRLGEADLKSSEQNALFNASGQQVSYRLENEEDIAEDMLGHVNAARAPSAQEVTSLRHPQPTDLDEAARAELIAESLGGYLVDGKVDEFEPRDDFEEEDPTDRSHPLTSLGRFKTSPSTFFLPKDTFVRPIQDALKNSSNKHLRDVSERTFGGPGLPDSPLTPRSGRVRQQVPIPLEAGQRSMGAMEANAFMTAVMPPTYASIRSTLVETRKRLGSSWLNRLLAREGGPRILDAGSGGVGALAWRDIVDAHWEALHSSDRTPPPTPESKLVVLTGSDALREGAAKLLENTTFVPRLPDTVHTRSRPTLEDDRPAQKRKQFDLIISSHSLFPLKEEWERKQHVQNLWSLLSDDGGVLIMIEKGIPRGFETIAAARDLLLERFIAVPEGLTTHYSAKGEAPSPPDEIHEKIPGMIVAPCTNHERCPLFKMSGVSKGRKDICSFQQRYIRPPFLQNVLGAKDRNFDDVDFSYISVMKGEDLRTRRFSSWEHVNDPMSAPRTHLAGGAKNAEAQVSTASDIQQGFEHVDPTWSDSAAPPPAHTLPRIINPPLKRQGHVVMDLCTPQAEIRRWTIPKSFSRQAYRDARKARWGDLWALGAKTNIARNLKLGTPQKDMIQGEGMKGEIGKPLSRKERQKIQTEHAGEAKQAQHARMTEEEREEELFRKMIEQDDLLDAEDGDDGDFMVDMDTLAPKKPKKYPHAKIDGVNIIASKKASQPAAPSPHMKQRAAVDKQRASHPRMQHHVEGDIIDQVDYTPGRYGDYDNLAAWSDDLNDKMLDDEARRGVEGTGRRATQKNTQRFKRELRRARRDLGDV